MVGIAAALLPRIIGALLPAVLCAACTTVTTPAIAPGATTRDFGNDVTSLSSCLQNDLVANRSYAADDVTVTRSESSAAIEVYDRDWRMATINLRTRSTGLTDVEVNYTPEARDTNTRQRVEAALGACAK